MSRYVYAGEFVNPANCFAVAENPDGEGYIVVVNMTAHEILDGVIDGNYTVEEAAEMQRRGWRPHTSAGVFAEWDDAREWIEGVEESFDADYEEYLEENRYEIAQMERYEAWRNEY